MARVVWFQRNMFGTVGSDVTSEQIAIGDAVAWTATITSADTLDSGASSVVTAQVSNWTGDDAGAAPDATFVSNYSASGEEVIVGDPGFKYLRFLRSTLTTIDQPNANFNKMIG